MVRLVNCNNCGKITTNKKYCSRSCSVTQTNKGVRRHGSVRKCLRCEKEHSNEKFCSYECKLSSPIELWLAGKQYFELKHFIRKFLLEEIGHKCSLCGWCEVNPITKRVPLEIDHIDGNPSNNKKENLRVLCPNCHSLTSTYKALNKGNNPRPKRNSARLVKQVITVSL